MNLRKRTAAGVFWVAVGRILSRGFSFLTTLILARMLAPNDFGLVWIADLAIQGFQLFQELGLGAALVYRKDQVEEAADSVFWGVLVTSVVLYAIALGAARPVAVLFSNDAVTVSRVVPILRVLALTLVISGFGRVPHAFLARQLSFKRKVLPQILGGIFGAGVSITMAILGFGVWAIVGGRLCQSLVSTIAVWPLARWRPRFRFDRSLAGDLIDYAKHIAGSQILVFLITNIDDAVVSRFIGPAALGHYGLAYKLSNMPATEVSRLLTQVMFPAFSLVSGDRERLKAAFLKTTRFVSLLSIPLSFLIIAFADDFIFAAYGRPWAAAIAPLRWLGVYGLVRSVAVNMGSVFKATGKPKWLFYIAVWRLCTMAALLYPVTIRWGIVGVSAFPDLDEKRPPLEEELPPTAPATPGAGLRPSRLAEPFEKLRDRSDRHLARTGKRPAVFLANLGAIHEHRARAAFAENFFAAGGIESIANDGFDSPAAAAEAFGASGAKLCAICSSDLRYIEAVPELAPLLVQRGAIVIVAGRPGDAKAKWRSAGVKHFIHMGCDALSDLRTLLKEAEVQA